MKRLAITIMAGLVLSALAVAPAHADINDIRRADNGIDLSVGAGTLRYGESDGTTLDTESGLMPGLGFGTGILLDENRNPIFRNLFLRFEGQAVFGHSDYNGGLQNIYTGQVTPYKTKTNNTIFRLSGKFGRTFPLFSQFALTPFGDISWRHWERKLTGIGGYTEDYEHGEFLVGGMAQWSPVPKWVFSASGEVGTTFAPSMSTGGVTYDLGERMAWRGEGKIGYAFMQHLEATASVKFGGFSYGKSPVIGGVYEPDSATHEMASFLGLAYHLQ